MEIAVIIPAYNAAAWLEPCIRSVLEQTRSACQVIVVDDGSTDATPSCREIFDDAITYLRQDNAGVCAARNLGASVANAEWLLFLDADDRLRPDALAALAKRAAEGSFDLVYGRTLHFDDASGKTREHGHGGCEGPIPAGSVGNFWKSVPGSPGAVLLKADLLRRAGGFNPRFDTAADRDLWLRCGTLTPFGFTNALVLEKRTHFGNMSGNVDKARRQGAEVQLAFLDWCTERGVPLAPLQTSVHEILVRNIVRAIEQRAFTATAWLCAEAEARDVHDPTLTRARRYLAMPPVLRAVELAIRERLSRFAKNG